jgi:transcriptional regulator with XRE-family HTH domain
MPLPTLASDKHSVAQAPRDTPPSGAALGSAVRRLRTAKRASIETLAFDAGLHPTSVQKIERAERHPTWATLCRLAAALGLTVSALAAAAESEACRQSCSATAGETPVAR